MTERESWKDIAAEVDKQVEEGREVEGVKPIKAKVSQSADAVFSIRMTYEDMALLRRHTQKKGIKMSEFARDAMMKAMVDDNGDPLVNLVVGAQQLATLARKVQVSTEAENRSG